jgi:hypothetical protein
VAAAQALDHVGLPEAQYALAQATTYISTAPKSNRSGLAYFAAAGDVETRGSLPVPLHLRSAGDRRMKAHGIGVGYRYPQEFEGADVDQQYLPDELVDRRYLPADRPGLRGDDRRPPGGPQGGTCSGEEGRQDAAQPAPDAGCRQERPDAGARDGPQAAGRDREEGRERLEDPERAEGLDQEPRPERSADDDHHRRLFRSSAPTRRPSVASARAGARKANASAPRWRLEASDDEHDVDEPAFGRRPARRRRSPRWPPA